MQQHLIEISTKIKSGFLGTSNTMKMQREMVHSHSSVRASHCPQVSACVWVDKAKGGSHPKGQISDYANLGLGNEVFDFNKHSREVHNQEILG